MNDLKVLPEMNGNNAWYELTPYKHLIESKKIVGVCKYDFVIVGAGFTGVSVARRLAELNPEKTIALVDAMKVGQGASGRNSGFMLEVPAAIKQKGFDLDRDSQLLKINRNTIQQLHSLMKLHGIEADWNESGKYLAAAKEENSESLDGYADTLKQLGVPHDILNQTQLKKKMGTDFYKKAVYTRGDVLVDPASLIIGLANSLPENVHVFQENPVESISYETVKKLKFEFGVIETERLVMATNAFSKSFGIGSTRLAPMFTYASVTRVLTKAELKNFKKIKPYGLTPAHAAGSTVRFTSDNRILVRNSIDVTAQSKGENLNKARESHRQSLINRFPSLEYVPFEFSWGGLICITLNGKPFFSEVHPGVFSAAGMNGTGIVKGTFLGYYLADHMMGVRSPELEFIQQYSEPSWMPPEPFASIGAKAAVYLEQRIAGIEI